MAKSARAKSTKPTAKAARDKAASPRMATAKASAPPAAPKVKSAIKAASPAGKSGPRKAASKKSPARKTRAQTYAASDPVFAAGLEVRHAMWGPAGGEDQINAASDFLLPLQEVVTRYCFGETWTREALSRRDRSLVTLGILVSQARPNELKVHVRGALANGVTKEEIGEVLRHAMVYCGVPRGVEAFRSAAEVLRELGLD